jgi:glucose/arabinose dehydrogenase
MPRIEILLMMASSCTLYSMLTSVESGGVCLRKLAEAVPDSIYTLIVPHPVLPNTIITGTQQGRLDIFQSDPDSGSFKRLGQFLDLANSVATDGERGLLGLAFHPKYAINGRVFVSSTCATTAAHRCPSEGASVVDEYVVSSPTTSLNISSAPLNRILEVDQPYSNHNGGQILFSPDGFLMVMLGDGGGDGRTAQNGSSLLGKVLRLDVNSRSGSSSYTIPSTNPFVGKEDILDEIFALGLRNPWRCSYDRTDMLSGARDAPLYCGDVGQNKVEEVDRLHSGANGGWNAFEGTQPYDTNTSLLTEHLEPVYQYEHSGPTVVIGGYFYR